MDLSNSHGQAQRLLRQRNLLAIGCALLFGVCVLLTLTAASRDREVVLQPVLAKPLTLSSSHVDKDYLELVTRDAALLTLNRSPSNLQYWMESILEITDPRTHGRMKAELMKIMSEQNALTRDLARGLALCEGLEAGSVWLNDIQRSSHYVPFGGMKESGLGREKGRYGVESYLEYKTLYLSWESPL